MNTYKIYVYPRYTALDPYKFHAVFDAYDGAPIDDETPSRDKVGNGETEIEAMYDLLEQSL